jgi:hypothetical protein
MFSVSDTERCQILSYDVVDNAGNAIATSNSLYQLLMLRETN